MYQRTPRSTRITLVSSQMRKMSVALLDHGEMVPARGTTVATRSPAFCGWPVRGP